MGAVKRTHPQSRKKQQQKKSLLRYGYTKKELMEFEVSFAIYRALYRFGVNGSEAFEALGKAVEIAGLAFVKVGEALREAFDKFSCLEEELTEPVDRLANAGRV